MRVMTFGCSFTKYRWPTWADIVLKQAKAEAGIEGDNWGLPGAGNLFIAIQVQQAIANGLLKKGDHAFISWSTMSREDRFIDGKWVTPGNIFNQSTYSQDWVKKYADMEFYVLRDCSLINATRAALDGLGITQTQFNMTWNEPTRDSNDPALSTELKRVNKILDIYKCKFDSKPILDVLGYPPPVTVQVNWSQTSIPNIQTDTHHHPASMLHYVKQELTMLGIPWLTVIRPEVESWAIEWDNKIKKAPKPLQISDYPFPMPKNQQWGIF